MVSKRKFGSATVVKLEEQKWLPKVKHAVQEWRLERSEEELDNAAILTLPKEVLNMKPEAFIPQTLSIGPYYFWRSELHESKRYKMEAARRFFKKMEEKAGDGGGGSTGWQFEGNVVAAMVELEQRVRSCYDRRIQCSAEGLAWLMTIDGIFVLECLQFYVKMSGKFKKEKLEGVATGANKLGKALDSSGATTTHNNVLKDLTKLENQIPLFVLEKLLELQLGSQEKAQRSLARLLGAAFTGMSPFSGLKIEEHTMSDIEQRAHILEALYYSLVPPGTLDKVGRSRKKEKEPQLDEHQEREDTQVHGDGADDSSHGNPRKISEEEIKRVFQPFSKAASALKALSNALKHLGNLPVVKNLKKPLTAVLAVSRSITKQSKSKDGEENGDTSETVIEVPPTREELDVPSATALWSAGVNFEAVEGDLTSIAFNKKRRKLRMAGMKIDTNTDVLVRNLVAYEMVMAPGGALVFTRYMDLMNGMIDTAEDVALLRKCGVLKHYLSSDLEVSNLWNGMGGCVKMTKVEFLDKVIKDLNDFYSRTWRVRLIDSFSYYVFGSWQVLSLLAAVLLLSLTCLQAFCSVYNCRKWLNDNMA